VTVASDPNSFGEARVFNPPMIGIFGGTFDPIHFGHIRTVSAVQARLELTKVLLVPVHIPPHRPIPVARPEHRISMTELAIKGTPFLECDGREIRRGGISYTISTIQEIRREVGSIPLCLILGLDSFLDFSEWHRWGEILNYVHIIVMYRPGWRFPPLLPDWWREATQENSAKLREKENGYVYSMLVPSIDLASTIIRQQLLCNMCVSAALPPAVLRYIRRYRLYGK